MSYSTKIEELIAERDKLKEVNAQLLEALTEILQSLEYVYQAHPETSGRGKSSEDIERAKAAIAKAKE